jgi:putative FmdB family regulatory protein
MPLYEYECDTCGHRFEVIQKFSDSPLTECPKCQGPVRKLISSPAIQFKGSGWYITDYAKKSGTGAGTPGKGEGAGEGAGDKAAATSGDKSSGTGSSADAGSKTDGGTTSTKTPTPSS